MKVCGDREIRGSIYTDTLYVQVSRRAYVGDGVKVHPHTSAAE